MNDIDTEMEASIRGALATDSARAPRPAPQWDDLPRYAAAPGERRRSPWGKVAVVGLAAATIGGALALHSTTASNVRVAAFVPPGIEYPLTDLGPARTSQSVTISGLSRELIVNGGDTIKVLRTIGGPVGGPTAAEQVCVTFESIGFCPSDMVVGGIPETFGDSGDGGMSSSDGVNGLRSEGSTGQCGQRYRRTRRMFRSSQGLASIGNGPLPVSPSSRSRPGTSSPTAPTATC